MNKRNKKILKIVGICLAGLAYYAAKLYFNCIKWFCLIAAMTAFPIFGIYYITNNCWGKK